MAGKYACVSKKDCVACGACANVCPRGAIKVVDGSFALVDEKFCLGCGLCAKICPAGAVSVVKKEVL